MFYRFIVENKSFNLLFVATATNGKFVDFNLDIYNWPKKRTYCITAEMVLFKFQKDQAFNRFRLPDRSF